MNGEYEMKSTRFYLPLGLALLVALGARLTLAQDGSTDSSVSSAFTYQGRLTDTAGNPVDDTCDFRFSLWNDATTGTQTGSTLDVPGVPLEGGLFTVQLDFGPVFDGTALWLKIEVQCTGDVAFVALSPRQALTAAPYALYAMDADTLDGLESANLARIGRYYIPGGTGGSVAIAIPHYNAFQVTIGEAFGSPDRVAWLSGIENDGDLAWLAIDSNGVVSTGTCDLGNSTQILTLGTGITLSCPGNGNLELSLVSSYEDVRAFITW
jgi:hypothetical protein